MAVGRLELGDCRHAGNASRLKSLRGCFGEGFREDLEDAAEQSCSKDFLPRGVRSFP
jgi:hypothetical protein